MTERIRGAVIALNCVCWSCILLAFISWLAGDSAAAAGISLVGFCCAVTAIGLQAPRKERADGHR